MPDTLREDLRRLIAEQQVLVIVGSGVSIAATHNAAAASWSGLLQLGVQQCGKLHPQPDAAWTKREQRLQAEIDSGELADMLGAAEKIAQKLGAPNGPEFRLWLEETVGALPLHDLSLLEALRDLDLPLATTNYDDLLTRITGRPAVTWREPAKVSRILQGQAEGILHLHGHWEQPDSVVLGIRAYEQVRQAPHTQAVIRALAMTKSLLFIGCGDGLSDPNFRPFLSWLGDVNAQNLGRHFRLARNHEVAELQRDHPLEQRIFVLPYGAQHADLAGFLRALAPGAAPRPGKKPTGKKTLPPPSPPLSPAIVAYVRRLREATAKLQLVGIGKGVQIELPIEQAYIPLNVMAQGKFSGAQPEHFDKLVLAAEGRGDAPVELSAIFQHALAHGQRGVILLGDPGAGKTTGARQFCWRVLTAPDVPAALGLPREVVPVFLRLRDLQREHTTLNAFICAAVAASALPAEKANPGPDLLAREGVLWVFDGLDEVVDEAARIRVCQWIDAAREQRTEDYFLVTSRYQGYQGKVNLGASFCQFQVRPLTTEQVREFVAHWYRAVFRRLQKEEADAAVEIASLLKLLNEPDYRIGRLRELPANPLMLTILCVVHHENHNLPRRRADLYARCVRVLVEHWRRALRPLIPRRRRACWGRWRGGCTARRIARRRRWRPWAARRRRRSGTSRRARGWGGTGRCSSRGCGTRAAFSRGMGTGRWDFCISRFRSIWRGRTRRGRCAWGNWWRRLGRAGGARRR